MSTSQDGKTVEDGVAQESWTNEDQERRKRKMQANPTKLKEWTASGRINGLKMEVSKFWDLKTLSVSNEAVFGHLKQLFYSFPYPDLAAQVIGKKSRTGGKRLKARVSTALRICTPRLNKSEWALASFLPNIIFSWRPLCGLDPTPVGEDERKDVCLEDIASAFEESDQVRAAIRANLDKKDWRPAIKAGIQLTQQMEVGPT
ncbi:hypothetical protein Plhal703r1_c19g0084841 [Plasmopara halstedii]